MFGSRKDNAVSAPEVQAPTPTAYKAPAAAQKMPEGFIGAHITIKGDVHFEGEFKVQGRVVGNVIAVGDSPSVLHVENGAEINGNVNVHTVKVDGFVSGAIDSADLVSVSASGEVSGPIRYNKLSIESGAIIDGQLTPVESTASSVEEEQEVSHSYGVSQE